MFLISIPTVSKSTTISFPSNEHTLSKAIQSASDGDIILLANGTHMCTETILIDKDITIQSNAKGCTIDFLQKGQFKFVQNDSKLAYIKFIGADNTAVICENASPEFEACTFTNNSGEKGGAVYCKEGEPVFRLCYFNENNAQNGGALYLDENANATLKGCLVYTNTANESGGGIYAHKASPTFSLVNINFNSAATRNGGGLFISNVKEINTQLITLKQNSANNGNGGGLYIENSPSISLKGDMIENSAKNGGGLYIENSPSISLKGYEIVENLADDGAGIYITDSDASVVQQCKICANEAKSENGGAIYIKNSNSTQLINLLVSENEAQKDGGGVYYDNCASGSNIIFCTFVRNESNSSLATGIVYFNNTPGTIVNTIFWNSGYNEIESVNKDHYPLSVTYSDVEMANPDNVYFGEGNINMDPVFENLAEKKADLYLHLDGTSSPCVNSGKPGANENQVDFYNVDRSKHGDEADMGAIEYTISGVEFTASPEFGRDPLLVEIKCKVAQSGDYQSYSLSMDYGDGSDIVEGNIDESNQQGKTFTHNYNSGGELFIFKPTCKIYFKEHPDIYSIADGITINVASFLWKFDTGDVIESSPAIGPEGSIFVGSDSGAMFCINTDGTQEWRFQTGGRIISSPSVYSNTVIFGSEDSKVYKLNASNREELWTYDTHGEIYSSPAIDKSGNIYIGSCDYNLYALTPDGDLKWSFYTNNRVISSPVIVYYTFHTKPYNNAITISTIYFGSHDNHLYALDLDTGDYQWSIDVGGDIWGTPAISNDRTIYVAAADLMSASNTLNLFALNPDGSIKWKHEMQRGAYASPILFSSIIKSQTVGMVLMGSYDNNLYGLSYSGYEQFTFPTTRNTVHYPADILSSPAIDSSGYIYFGSENHWIYAIDHEKGKVQWSYKTNGPLYSSPVIHNNVLYMGSFDHHLYAIRTTEKSLSASSPWPMYHQNPAHHSCITIDDRTMPPTILKTIPESNATGLASNIPITLSVQFSKIMNTNSIDISFEKAIESETLASDKITFSEETINGHEVTVASFQPISSTLEPDTRYKVRIASTAMDKDNNKLQGDWVWVFFSENSEGDADQSGMRGCFIDSLTLDQ